ncbi:DUF4439 domain-containing protein [Streptacidiphilus sp. 4-A2]|nr:DUF4439 domain-containing protein [Streptacidiphilus sp. 4-A2]
MVARTQRSQRTVPSLSASGPNHRFGHSRSPPPGGSGQTVASVLVTTLPPASVRRRALLGAGLLGLLTACGAAAAHGGRAARPAAETDPDTAVRLRELAATEALAARYDAALPPASPALAARLRPLRAQLAAQLTAFGPPRRRPAAAPPPRPAAAPAPSRDQAPAPLPLPRPPRRAPPSPAVLAAAELATAQRRGADLLAASPALARLIASVAAAGAQHAVLLGGSAPAAVPLPAGGALPAAALAALQAALAAEDAAVYGYGVIGAQLDSTGQGRAAELLAGHQDQVRALTQRISAAAATPATAAPGYELPFPVDSAADAVRMAALLEERLADVYANGVQAASGPLRTALASALQGCALASLSWSGSGSAFPGLPERGAPH